MKSDLTSTVPVVYPIDQQPLAFTVEGPQVRQTDDGLRFYTWKGEEYPSVTTVRRIAGIPFPLHQWALSKVIDRAVSGEAGLHDPLDPDTKKWLRRAATDDRDKAADRGKRLHFAVESGIEADEDIAALAAQQKAFLDRVDADVLISEAQVWSPTFGYAGTLDAIADITVNGRRVRAILDWKTGKRVYVEHALQLAAYSGADFIGANDVINKAATKLLGEVSRLAVVHLSDTAWELVDFAPTPQLWDAWLGLLDFAKFIHAHPHVSTLIRGENSLSSVDDIIVGPGEPAIRDAMVAPSFRGGNPFK